MSMEVVTCGLCLPTSTHTTRAWKAMMRHKAGWLSKVILKVQSLEQLSEYAAFLKWTPFTQERVTERGVHYLLCIWIPSLPRDKQQRGVS